MSEQDEAIPALQIQFEVTLVPASESNDTQGFLALGYAPVFSSLGTSSLARVSLGGRDFNIVMGKTQAYSPVIRG
jgi:hypothetical protein